MKNTIHTIFFSAAVMISSITLVSSTEPSAGSSVDTTMPLVSERQYFSYKGHNSSTVTLESLHKFDCQMVMDMYDESPVQALNDVGLIILVQKALEGIDVQTMTTIQREGLVSAEIMKKLRQMGRTREAAEFRAENAKQVSVVPSIAALCHILEDEKNDILQQKSHFEVKPNWPTGEL